MPWSGGAASCGMGPPRWSRHLCDRAPGATAHAGSCKGTLRTLLASTQASDSAGRAQPACHRSQANGVGGLCSEPPFLLRTHTLDPAGASRPRAPAPPPAIPPVSRCCSPCHPPFCGSRPAAVKAEPPARCCGRAACPSPARGMEELSEGTELLRGFPSGWQNRGHKLGQDQAQGEVGLLFSSGAPGG